MDLLKNFKLLFLSVWEKGILGVDIFEILIGVGIFFIFLIFRGIISKLIIKRLENLAKKTTNKFDETFIDKLKLNMPEIVFVYSQNSAISFLNFIKNYQLVDYWMNTNLMCLGEKTSSVLNEIKWKKIFLFSPGEEEFLLYKI